MGGGGNAKPKSKKSKHSNLKATDSTNSKQSTSQSTSQSDKSPSDYLTLAPSSNPKTGGFIGGEFTIAIQKANDTLVSDDVVYQSHTFSPIITPNINIIGGYQWYFYNKPHFNLGLRFNVYLGYSIMYSREELHEYTNIAGDVYNIDQTTDNIYHSLYYGADAQFLWDFLDRGSHTLGVHLSPLGFEGSIMFDGSVTNTKQENIENGNVVWSYSYSGKVTSADSRRYFTFYIINLGIHYYYNIHHQVFVTYKHRWTLSDVIIYKNGTKQKVESGIGNHAGQIFFGYSYKF